jgi:AraC-like DNA-binding protein
VSCKFDVSDGVRLGWACDTLNVYQGVVGKAIDGDPTCIESIGTHLKNALPAPANRAEWIHLLQSLIPFLNRVSHVLHVAYHDRFSLHCCPAVPRATSPPAGFDLETSVSEIPAQWAADYAAWFTLHHSFPAALRTKILLEQTFAEPLTLPRIAEAVRCSRTTLIEQFTAAFGLPPAEYLARVRMREGLRRLRRPSETVENVATEVGYRSGNKFYARMRRYADVTPSEVRRMTEAEFGQLLEDRISLRCTVRERHHAVKLPIAVVAADRRRADRRTPLLERRTTKRRMLSI